MSGIIPGLAGAGGAANTAGGYYTNAANDIVNATGSPAAATFGQLQNAQLRPQFQSAINQVGAQAAAQGITGSGSDRANLGNVTAQNAATLAGAEAPLYSQALGQYGSIIGQEPGAQNQAYQNAISQFYTGLQDAGSMIGGMPPSAQPGNYGNFMPSGSQVEQDQGYNPYYQDSGSGQSLGQQFGQSY